VASETFKPDLRAWELGSKARSGGRLTAEEEQDLRNRRGKCPVNHDSPRPTEVEMGQCVLCGEDCG